MKFWLNTALRLVVVATVFACGILRLNRKVIRKLQPSDVTDSTTLAVLTTLSDPPRTLHQESFIEGLSNRYKHLNDTCYRISLKTPGKTKHFIVNLQHELVYCDVGRAGSTFWKSVFANLSVDFNLPQSSDLMMNRWDKIHGLKLTNFNYLNVSQQNGLIRKKRFILLVRDPYRRLLSAYMDNFVRPNHLYWKAYGRIIVRYIRGQTTGTAEQCGHDVTFDEFVSFFIKTQTPGKTFRFLDRQWTPIYQLCQPCHFPFTYIGRTESMTKDTIQILQSLGLNGIFKPEHRTFHQELSQCLKLFSNEYEKVKNCTTLVEIAERFWLYMTAKGYFNPRIQLPFKQHDYTYLSLDRFWRSLHDKATEMYKKQSYPDSVVHYSRQFTSIQYNSISDGELLQLKNAVALDCQLFDYETEPSFIFSKRNLTNA